MTLDRKKLAVIHIVKKELRLSDEEYHALLKDVTGAESAKDLDERGFRRLMNYLVRDDRYRILPGGMTLKQKLFIEGLSRDLDWDPAHLANFINKYYHKPKLTELTRAEASKLIESLKSLQRRSSRYAAPP